MSEISAYCEAVARRKSIDRTKRTMTVNNAIVMQLEDSDLPLLLEIIREFDKAVSEIIDVVSDEAMDESDQLESAGRIAAGAHLRAEQLAAGGSKKKWGEHEASN